jgi:hypothetical protein
LIAFDSKYLKFYILKINTQNIDTNLLVKDNEDFVFIYRGIIRDYDISAYEMIDSNKIKFSVGNESSSYNNIYFKKIL